MQGMERRKRKRHKFGMLSFVLEAAFTPDSSLCAQSTFWCCSLPALMPAQACDRQHTNPRVELQY